MKKKSQDVENYGDNEDNSAVSDAKKPAEKPVSLHPLKFEEAVRDLLGVKPDKKPVPGAKG